VWCLVFSYYLAPPSAGPFVFGAPCFGHMRVETAGLFLPNFGPALRGAFCLVRAAAVLAQWSRPVKCFVSGWIEQKNGDIEQARQGGRDDIPCATTETTNGQAMDD
jgi:hypothetical protein